MKLNKWLYGVMGLAMLASCSDNNLTPSGGDEIENGGNDPSTTSGYLAVQINLPQQSSTRAGGENDNYDDGEAWEYNVSNALIVLFTGESETKTLADGKEIYLPKKASDVKFLRAQELVKPFFWNEDANDNITTSYLAAIEVVNKNFSDQLWAVVMLNRNTEKFSYDKPNNKFTVNGTEITTYQTLLDAITTSDDESDFLINAENGEKRIFMTNAPLSNVEGGKTGVEANLANPGIEILAHLGDNKSLYDNMETAKAHPAACIFVERALAKVSYGKTAENAIGLSFVQRVPQTDEDGQPVVDSDGNPVYIDTELKSADVTAKADVRYCLTNKNKKSYVIRNVDFSGENGVSHFNWALTYSHDALKTDYRMIGNVGMPALRSPFHQEKKNLYRTYWCKDPNYEVEMPDADKSSYTTADFQAVGNSLYAKENTFTVKYQSHGNTTLAIFEINFNIAKKTEGAIGEEKGNLYIRDDNKEKVYLTAEEAMAPVFLRVYNDNDIKTALNSLAKSGVTGTYKVTDYIDVKWTVSATDKKVTWTDITLKNIGADDQFFPTQVEVEKVDGTKETIPVAEAFERLIGTNNSSSTIKTKFNLLNDLNSWYDVTEYTGGISYYVVPIKHFGDEYCPWDGTGTATSETYNYNDSDHAHKWLGRYGMVRNNWYELNINAIKALGSAVPPTIEDELSDDFKEEKKYFAVEIHTLSWAKRTQNIEFK